MNHDGSEPSKAQLKFRCPLAGRKYGCSFGHPCSDSKYGRTAYIAAKILLLPARQDKLILYCSSKRYCTASHSMTGRFFCTAVANIFFFFINLMDIPYQADYDSNYSGHRNSHCQGNILEFISYQAAPNEKDTRQEEPPGVVYISSFRMLIPHD